VQTISSPTLAPARPVAVAPSLARIAAVIPCFARQHDLDLALADLAAIDTAGIDLRLVVVDNASDPPLVVPERAGRAPIHLVRCDENRGGSGGYNAGIRAAMALDFADAAADEDPPHASRAEFVWLVDSDARVARDTLVNLLAPMRADPTVVVAGAAIADLATGRVFEVGGRICARRGLFKPASRGSVGLPHPVDCDYAAACCALVRASAVRRAGLMPDVFLNGDDTEWCVRLKRISGGRVIGVPNAVAAHPMFDKFQTWARYYHARNCFGAIDALRLPRTVLFRRALHEVGRACSMAAMSRPDLANLHLAGLRDAADRDAAGPAPADRLAFHRFTPWSNLADSLAATPLATSGERTIFLYDNVELPERTLAEIRSQLGSIGISIEPRSKSGLAGFLKRALLGPRDHAAIVPARGRPGTWFAASTSVAATTDGFILQKHAPLGALVTAGATAATAVRGVHLGIRLALRRRRARTVIPALDHDDAAPPLTLATVVLSHNRWPTLKATLERLLKIPGIDPASIIVVDNASTDGTPDHLRHLWPEIRLLALETNIGVEAFNRGVNAVSADLVLILDDDAWPEPGTLRTALALLAKRPDLGAVALNPVHPRTQKPEWPFARLIRGGADDRWPVMGCGNLVRREVWKRVGGYDPAFFLYRNDADLAQKILALGLGVRFDPTLVVWHDSNAARHKSPRWHEMATRNWVWLCRRHGGTLSAPVAAAVGWAWAHRLAGLDVHRHWRTLKGVAQGIATRVPAADTTCSGEGDAIRRLLALRLGRR
jgi:GT2 family glycosyltransferase